MKRSRFTEEQIISILREQEGGVATAEICRRHGVSSATFYKLAGCEFQAPQKCRRLIMVYAISFIP